MNNMNKMKIRLNATADVQEFVRAAEKCDFDIDIQYDSTIVDAKSILGIFSLVNSNPRIPFVTQDSLFVNENPVL